MIILFRFGVVLYETLIVFLLIILLRGLSELILSEIILLRGLSIYIGPGGILGPEQISSKVLQTFLS